LLRAKRFGQTPFTFTKKREKPLEKKVSRVPKDKRRGGCRICDEKAYTPWGKAKRKKDALHGRREREGKVVTTPVECRGKERLRHHLHQKGEKIEPLG